MDRQEKAISRLESTAASVSMVSRLDDIATTLLDCIDEVRQGTMKPAQGNSIALLCSTLIKAMEAARGNTPQVSITAQLSKAEIEEILHGRDPFRTITVTDGAAATRANDPLSPATGEA